MARRAALQLSGFQPWVPHLKNEAVPALLSMCRSAARLFHVTAGSE